MRVIIELLEKKYIIVLFKYQFWKSSDFVKSMFLAVQFL